MIPSRPNNIVGTPSTRTTSYLDVPESEPANDTGQALPLSETTPDVRVVGQIGPSDTDMYVLNLTKGDFVGFAANGAGIDSFVTVVKFTGSIPVFAQFDIGVVSTTLPSDSPFPRISDPGSTLEAAGTFVAPESGAYFVVMQANPLVTYNLLLTLRRGKFDAATGHQVIFLDFDGATFDASALWPGLGNNPAVLSPLSAFLGNWGLGASDESAVIDAVLHNVHLAFDPLRDLNPALTLDIRNSRDHADPWGQENVTRIIVGGTTSELGITAHGIAESIDPGNFNTAETGVVMLDTLSDQVSPTSLNLLQRADGVTIIDAIGVGVGNIIAHEAGHLLGNYHTDAQNTTFAIMDAGTSAGNINFKQNHYNTGPDGILGNEDDVVSTFVTDDYQETIVAEPGSGEHVEYRTAFALSGTGCVGDLDDNGFVDGADLGLFLASWGAVGVTDLDGDGTTNGADLGLFLAQWGECP
ncbi:MAG: hypothetical protein ACF8GE_03820 [Phycisphaerales bacterium JB043]